MQNLFSDLDQPLSSELIETLLASQSVRIEKIVSQGHCSDPGYWYDQEEAEWVVVLRGEAKIRFEDEAEEVFLGSGDSINIAPNRRHRVEWTSPDEPTVWLAVFYGEDTK